MSSSSLATPSAETGKRNKAIRYVNVTAAYDLWSEVYDVDGNFLQALDTIEIRSLLPELLSHISAPSPWKVVDLGCGTGRNTLPLLKIPNSTVVGLDASPKMLDIARARIDKNLTKQASVAARAKDVHLELFDLLSGSELPTCATNADALVSTLVLEHVPIPSFFEVAAQILKPGGVALATNMHSDMAAIGQAGFVDTKTGDKVRTKSFAHRLDDVVEEAERQGFSIIGQVRERAVDEKMSELLGVRARKWIGVTVWFGLCFRKLN